MNSILAEADISGDDECLAPSCKTIMLKRCTTQNGGCFVHRVSAERSIFRLQALGIDN